MLCSNIKAQNDINNIINNNTSIINPIEKKGNIKHEYCEMIDILKDINIDRFPNIITYSPYTIKTTTFIDKDKNLILYIAVYDRIYEINITKKKVVNNHILKLNHSIISCNFIKDDNNNIYLIGNLDNSGGFIINCTNINQINDRNKQYFFQSGIINCNIVNNNFYYINEFNEFIKLNNKLEEELKYTSIYHKNFINTEISAPIIYNNRIYFIDNTSHLVILGEKFELIKSIYFNFKNINHLYINNNELCIFHDNGISKLDNLKLQPISILKHNFENIYKFNNKYIANSYNKIFIINNNNIESEIHFDKYRITEIGTFTMGDNIINNNFIWFIANSNKKNNNFFIYDLNKHIYKCVKIDIKTEMNILNVFIINKQIHIIYWGINDCLYIYEINL